MKRPHFLIVTAVGEGTAGLLFLLLPAALLTLLLGESAVTPERTLHARWFGTALLAFSVACWLVRNLHRHPSQPGMVLAALTYDVTAAGFLAYLGLAKGMVGIVLWPAILVHAALTVWGVACLWEPRRPEDNDR